MTEAAIHPTAFQNGESPRGENKNPQRLELLSLGVFLYRPDFFIYCTSKVNILSLYPSAFMTTV